MWIRLIGALFLLGLLGRAGVAQETGVPGDNLQVEQAVLAAPESMRKGATVLGYGGKDRPGDALTVLREGTNDLICLADDPEIPGFHVACYHRSLDDFMVLGRRSRAEGLGRDEIMDARYAALASGELMMPDRAVLYSVSAEGGSAAIEGARRLVVVYVPGATVEDLGLPSRPEGSTPWLMLPGTPWAHIMVGQ